MGDRKRGQHGPMGCKDGQEAIVVYVQWGARKLRQSMFNGVSVLSSAGPKRIFIYG